MAREIKETAHLNINYSKYGDMYDQIDWGKKEKDMAENYSIDEALVDRMISNMPAGWTCGEVQALQDQLKEANEVIGAWMIFENLSIQQNGEYVELPIKNLIKRAREYLNRHKIAE